MTVLEAVEQIVDGILGDTVKLIVDACKKVPELDKKIKSGGTATFEAVVYHAINNVSARKVRELSDEIRRHQKRF